MTDARPLDEIRQTIHRHWREIALSTTAIDKARARKAVDSLYIAAVGRPPLWVLFFASPLEAELACGFFAGAYPQQPLRRRRAGQRVRRVIERRIGGVRDSFFDRMIGRRLMWHDQVRAAVDAVEIPDRQPRLARAFQALTSQLSPLARQLVITPAWRPKPRGQTPQPDVEQLVGLADWMTLSAYYTYCKAAFPDRRIYAPREPLIAAMTEVCKTCGWCAFYDDIAIVTDRPAFVQLDAAERPHAERGPALTYRDGFSVFALRGMWVHRRLTEGADRITVADIENQPNMELRRILLDRMGHGRYLTLSGAEPVARDESGTLWRRHLPNIGSTRREWCFVEVINGTREPDGSHRHYYLRVPRAMRSAREAVAWTYGLGASEYEPLIRT